MILVFFHRSDFLTLFVPGIGAYHPQYASTLDYFAIIANFLD